MITRSKFGTIVILIAGCLLIILFGIIVPTKNIPVIEASNGIIDLKSFDFDKFPIVELKGDWFYYNHKMVKEINSSKEKQLIEVPHFWESDKNLNNNPHGYGSYQVYLTGLSPDTIYGIHMIDQVASYTIYSNEKPIMANGIVAKSKETYQPSMYEQVGYFESDSDGTAELCLEIANFDYYRGGFWNAIKIGDPLVLTHFSQQSRMQETFIAGSLLSLGLFFILLYVIARTDKATLFIGLFSINVAFRTALTSTRIIHLLFNSIPWVWLNRLEYFSGYLLIPLFILFISHIHYVHKRKPLTYLLYASILFTSMITLILPSDIYTIPLVFYKFLAVVSLPYYLYIVIQGLIKKYREAYLFLFVTIVITIAIIKEVFFPNEYSFVPYAVFISVLLFSILTMINVMQISKEKDTLKTKVIRDNLTGLYNRHYLEYLQDIPLAKMHLPNNLYVLFLDLDKFKPINDTLGHNLGDYVLRQISNRLQESLGTQDYLFRYGGDEFVILAYAKNNHEVEEMANRIIDSITQPITVDNHSVNIGISIGIRQMLIDDKLETCISKSDQMMYEAKHSGGNCFILSK